MKAKVLQSVQEAFLLTSSIPYATWDEAVKAHPFALRQHELMRWVNQFRQLGKRKKHRQCQQDSSNGFATSHRAHLSTASKNSRYSRRWPSQDRDYSGNSIQLLLLNCQATFHQGIAYSLVILDPPYGITKEPWDTQAFTRQDLAHIFGAFRFIDPRYSTSEFFCTFMIFCAHQQLSHFIDDEIELQGYPYDVMVWTKPNTTPQCNCFILRKIISFIFKIHF